MSQDISLLFPAVGGVNSILEDKFSIVLSVIDFPCVMNSKSVELFVIFFCPYVVLNSVVPVRKRHATHQRRDY